MTTREEAYAEEPISDRRILSWELFRASPQTTTQKCCAGTANLNPPDGLSDGDQLIIVEKKDKEKSDKPEKKN